MGAEDMCCLACNRQLDVHEHGKLLSSTLRTGSASQGSHKQIQYRLERLDSTNQSSQTEDPMVDCASVTASLFN